MMSVTLEVRGVQFPAEILKFSPQDNNRSVYRVRTGSKLTLGESCRLVDAAGRSLECFVTKVEETGAYFMLEMRCIADAEFAARPADLPESNT